MRRVHLRGRENVLKRQLIHVCAFNLSLIFRLILGAGTPRELRNRQHRLIFLVFWLNSALKMSFIAVSEHFQSFCTQTGKNPSPNLP